MSLSKAEQGKEKAFGKKEVHDQNNADSQAWSMLGYGELRFHHALQPEPDTAA